MTSSASSPISTGNILETNEFQAQAGARWTFLSHVGRKIQRGDLDIQQYTDPHNPTISHTLVLTPRLVIHSIYNGCRFWGRPSFEDLRGAACEIRPGWDLATGPARETGTPATARCTTRTGWWL